MNNSALRSLITFAILVPLAVFMGYMLADPLQYSTFATIGIVLGILGIPILLKWHQPVLLLSWNMGMVIPFIKGQPNLFLVMAAVTLTIAVLQRTLSRDMRFIQVPSITAPLVFLIMVILLTAKLTGGFGLRAFGSDVYGGKKYVFFLCSIAAYFALTAWRIEPGRAKLYVGLFFAGSIFSIISDLFVFAPSSLQFIYWFFPPSAYVTETGWATGTARFAGVCLSAQALMSLLILRYGLRGIFLSAKLWRISLFVLLAAVSTFGGFRSALMSIALLLTIQFFLEGLHRTKLLPFFIGIAIIGLALLVPLAPKLPFSAQRALAFLPLEISSAARLDAEGSTQWRLDMWQAVLPQVPHYFWLGKGYAISQEDYQMMGNDSSFRAVDAGQQGLALAGDYHSGPLSVIIPFGIWGAIAFCWFIWAGIRLLHRNYKYGDPELKIPNTFIFSLFLVKLAIFIVIVGGLNSDIATFAGLLGLSVSLNNGMAKKPVLAAEAPMPTLSRPRLLQPRPSFQR